MTLHPVHQRLADEATFGERVADRAVARIGTWAFLIVQAVVIAAWIVAVRSGVHLDNAQLTILNLILSCQAAVTGPLLLLAGNRQSVKDRATAAADYAADCEALAILRRLDPGGAP